MPSKPEQFELATNSFERVKVIFCEPLLCNSYSLLVHVYLFSYGSLRHVKHMLQPLLLAQEK